MITSQPHIFIVEDDPVYSKVITLKLKKNGFSRIKSFSSGEKSLDEFHLNPDFVILDFSLDGLNGLDTLKIMKGKRSSTQIVVLTGVADEALAEKCIESGAGYYLVKEEESIQVILGILSKIRNRKKTKMLVMFTLLLVIAYLVAYYLI